MELIQLAVFVGLLGVGFIAGRVIESRHYVSLRRREAALRHVLAFASRFPPDCVTAQQAFLVSGTVVISSDYFKTFVAGLRNLIGGRFRGYETLLERARREAVLRLKEEAQARGASLVICVRFESTALTAGYAPSIEVFVNGTRAVP